MRLRGYQSRTVADVEVAWTDGARSVLVVAATGSGKTEIGAALVGSRRTLWVAHQRELVKQAAKRLRERIGSVGIIMPGEHETPSARIQCGTVQTLVARGVVLDVDLVVLDEAHHYLAEHWRALLDAFPNAKLLGLTATPERKDGEPLGDIFEQLVVAAKYSELLAGGWLVPARVLQPPKNLGNDLAIDPVTAWAEHSEGSRAFSFHPLVEIAEHWAKQFRDHGVNAQTIHAETPTRDRDQALTDFRAGRVLVIPNVNTMTEGIDVPEARAVLLGRAFGHVGAYLQAVGRVLRPAEDKPDAIVIDLTGATIRHGMPDQDRVYSLKGRAISGGSNNGGGGPGDLTQEILGTGLRVAKPGAPERTAQPVKLHPIPESVRRDEFKRLLGLARQHRMRDGFAAAKYREKFGEWPRSEWA